jgi:2Fe-2S ferredoxin
VPKITFIPAEKSFDVAPGTTILVAAVQNGLHLRHDCTEAVCGTDRVKILSGAEQLSEITDNEELTLEMMNAGPNERLACVARIAGDVIVELPE